MQVSLSWQFLNQKQSIVRFPIGKIQSILQTQGLFVQENASAALASPGQHPGFGAKTSWPSILKLLRPDRKLIYLIRHGEAVSNAVQAAVGELAWSSVATACEWENRTSGQILRLFDPSLTSRGEQQVLAESSLAPYTTSTQHKHFLHAYAAFYANWNWGFIKQESRSFCLMTFLVTHPACKMHERQYVRMWGTWVNSYASWRLWYDVVRKHVSNLFSIVVVPDSKRMDGRRRICQLCCRQAMSSLRTSQVARIIKLYLVPSQGFLLPCGEIPHFFSFCVSHLKLNSTCLGLLQLHEEVLCDAWPKARRFWPTAVQIHF